MRIPWTCLIQWPEKDKTKKTKFFRRVAKSQVDDHRSVLDEVWSLSMKNTMYLTDTNGMRRNRNFDRILYSSEFMLSTIESMTTLEGNKRKTHNLSRLKQADESRKCEWIFVWFWHFHSLAFSVVTKLCSASYGKWHKVVFDNFFYKLGTCTNLACQQDQFKRHTSMRSKRSPKVNVWLEVNQPDGKEQLSF